MEQGIDMSAGEIRELEILLPGARIKCALEVKPGKQHQEGYHCKHPPGEHFFIEPALVHEQEVKQQDEEGYTPKDYPFSFGKDGEGDAHGCQHHIFCLAIFYPEEEREGRNCIVEGQRNISIS